ncbi:hypothetical protein Syun_027669 [Stephania yunnanensis]|uniref:Uncharacterized protein n=1 Tax=Stephania yunnanensis TaxID=152371 RepID=A0AAP0HL90_9MAGN
MRPTLSPARYFAVASAPHAAARPSTLSLCLRICLTASASASASSLPQLKGYNPSSGEGSGRRSSGRSSGISGASRDHRYHHLGHSHPPSRDDATPPAQSSQGQQTLHQHSLHPLTPIELLRKDIKDMETSLLRVMQDNMLSRHEFREFQERLARMEQALIDRLGISFGPPRDVPDDSETDDDLDD